MIVSACAACLAAMGFGSRSAAEPPAPRVLVLAAATPGVAAAVPWQLVQALNRGGLSAELIVPDKLVASPNLRERADWLLLPDATHVPASAREPIETFVRAGGSLALIGPAPLSRPSIQIDGRWLVREEAEPLLSRSLTFTPLLSCDEVPEGQWRRSSNAPAEPTTVGPSDDAIQGGSLRLDIKGLKGWDTHAAPISIPAGHHTLSLWVRGSEKVSQIAVEVREPDGARWIASVPVSGQWAQRLVGESDFAYHGGGQKPARRLRLDNANVISLGLAKDYTKQPPGDHTLWIDEIATSPATLPGARLFETFELSARARNFSPRTAAKLVYADGGAGLTAEQGLSFTPVFAIPRDGVSRLVPLLRGADEQGTPIGDMASMLVHGGGDYAGSRWLMVGIDADDLLASPLAPWLAAALKSAPEPVDVSRPAKELPTVLGVCHVAGGYHFTKKDFVNEGADQLAELGTRSIKLWFNRLEDSYPYNFTWPKVKTMVEIAQLEPFAKVFADPRFDTYFLEAFIAGPDPGYWKRNPGAAKLAEEEQQFYDLSKHLMTTYRGSGKTFVLQNWEGDWAVHSGKDRSGDPKPEAFRAMIDWLNARQRGVDRARAEIGDSGVRVFHAAEVNQVKRCIADGRPGVVDQVLPYTNVDLASYSCYDTQRDPRLFRAALDYIAANLKPKPGIEGCRVYVGEYGVPETASGLPAVQRTLPDVVDISLAFGCPYILYWELYCNEAIRTPVVKNEDTRGFWLIKPDGTKAWAWELLATRMRGK